MDYRQKTDDSWEFFKRDRRILQEQSVLPIYYNTPSHVL